MSSFEVFITIALAVLATVATRFLPFVLLPKDKPTPACLVYLGQVLPPALFGMLVVYSLRTTDWTGPAHGAPELIALIATVIIHVWKRNMLVSIALGTILYMVLVQAVFV